MFKRKSDTSSIENRLTVGDYFGIDCNDIILKQISNLISILQELTKTSLDNKKPSKNIIEQLEKVMNELKRCCE